jgi:hypothetical protein
MRTVVHPPIYPLLVLLKHDTSAFRVHRSVTGVPSEYIVLLKEGRVSAESYSLQCDRRGWTSQLPSNTREYTRVMLPSRVRKYVTRAAIKMHNTYEKQNSVH